MPVLHGHDVFVCMATGAGKSLCMFLAPLAARENGIVVVISPLNGLMDEQVLEYACQIAIVRMIPGMKCNGSHSWKVRKLAHVGVPAVQVSELNRDSLELVAAGNFRFGMHFPPVV